MGTATTSDAPAVVPVGRLAPSPTGLLHLGHARTFLLAWWHIRSRGGTLLLRIEDLDGPRSVEELVSAATRDLEWLGLDWDGPVRRQSEHPEAIEAALSALIATGQAYPCVCSRGDLRTALSAPQQGVAEEPRYPGTCRGRFATLAEAEALSGKAAGLRFRVPAGSLQLHDAFAGTHSYDVAAEVGDFLVARRDRSAAYQLAVVADDAAQGVTEVLRGDDLLPSAARQWHLQAALNFPHPTWFHVPLVVDTTGRRLAKRAKDLGLAELRAQGVDPRAIVQWVAASCGLGDYERPRPQDLLANFELERVPKQPSVLEPALLQRLLQP